MIWDDKGFLISKCKYNENSVIADFFTSDYGRCSGIIFGATSNKIRGYLQIGNLFQFWKWFEIIRFDRFFKKIK